MSIKSFSKVQYIKTIGIVNNGNNGRGFANPYDVAISPDGNLFVLNRCDPARRSAIRVGVCNFEEDYLYEFGYGFGDGPGQMVWPVSMCFDSKSRIFITDEHNNRITIFSVDGEYVSHWGVKGGDKGTFNGPAGICIDDADDVYLVDQKNHRIQKYTSQGEFICQWGEQGSEEGQFNLPWGITQSREGDIYVADWRNDRVQVFDSKGTFIRLIGDSGAGSQGENLTRPTGVAIDSGGTVYVSDWGNERVQVYNSEGSYIYTLRGESTLSKWALEFFASNPDEMEQRKISNLTPELPDHLSSPYHISSQTESYFWGPVSLRIDQSDILYVVESNRHRIQIYQ